MGVARGPGPVLARPWSQSWLALAAPTGCGPRPRFWISVRLLSDQCRISVRSVSARIDPKPKVPRTCHIIMLAVARYCHVCLVGMEHGSRGLEHVPCSAHVPNIVSAHVPNVLRTSRIDISTKKPTGCPWQAKEFK